MGNIYIDRSMNFRLAVLLSAAYPEDIYIYEKPLNFVGMNEQDTFSRELIKLINRKMAAERTL